MAKYKKRKSVKPKACTSSVHKKGHFIEVKARCHVGKAKLTTAAARKYVPKKAAKGKVKHRRVTEIPAACKGLKKKTRIECVKRVCSLRQEPYKSECMKKAHVK